MPLPPSPSQGSRGKPATRQLLLALRDALSVPERAARSEKIADAAMAVLEERVAPGDIVAMYAAKGSEVDTAVLDAAARARGFVVAYPRVIGDGCALAFHAVRVAELVPARFGLREPRAEAPAIELPRVAAFVMPGLAFDRSGGRVGWGRGHYDATLAAAPDALRVGLAFELQVVERVAREAHDVPLHAICTEVATYTVA